MYHTLTLQDGFGSWPEQNYQYSQALREYQPIGTLVVYFPSPDAPVGIQSPQLFRAHLTPYTELICR